MKAVTRINLHSCAAALRATRPQASVTGASQLSFTCQRSSLSTINTSPLRTTRLPLRISGRCLTRPHSHDAKSRPLTDSERSLDTDTASQDEKEALAERKAQEPAYEITFTCRKCSTRSTHRITKQAYHHGTTLITCPECKNRHLISDHLKIFSDKNVTIEDILKEKGEFLKKGRLGEDGDVEFYKDDDKD